MAKRLKSTRDNGNSVPIVHIEVVWGGMTNVQAQVAVTGRYAGLDVAGPTKAFDKKLDGWLSRAIEMGMIGSDLGQLFPVNLEHRHQAGKINVAHLLLMGMGAPSEFTAYDLRYLMRNITVAVKCWRHDHMCTALFGTRRKELPVAPAVRAFVEGIIDGYDRLSAIAETITDSKEVFAEIAKSSLRISLVEADKMLADQILFEFEKLVHQNVVKQVQLEVGPGDPVPADSGTDTDAANRQPETAVTLLRVTRDAGFASPMGTVPLDAAATPFQTETFQYSAISDVAAVTVREVELNSFLVRELPNRIVGQSNAKDREKFGRFFTRYLVPEDFRGLLESAQNLTLVLDETTAAYPWEMAALTKYLATRTLGMSMGVSRRFHTLLSPPPSSPLPLNRSINLLVIADPVPAERYGLPGARKEGMAVVDAFDRAATACRGLYDFKATLRIGPPGSEAELEAALAHVANSNLVENAKTCESVEVAGLIVDEQFDIIHYAGHGLYDERSRRAGWVLDEDCFLSAQEIFRARQVPRLVFANACFSAAISNCETKPGKEGLDKQSRSRLVGLAQAFFARGIPNFIGTGWPVDDDCARECARAFYARLLGVKSSGDADDSWELSSPGTIGESLLEGRLAAYHLNKDSSSWGAYQHYGRVGDTILPVADNSKRMHGRDSTPVSLATH